MKTFKFNIVVSVKNKILFRIPITRKILNFLLKIKLYWLNIEIIKRIQFIYTLEELRTYNEIFGEFSFLNKQDNRVKKLENTIKEQASSIEDLKDRIEKLNNIIIKIWNVETFKIDWDLAKIEHFAKKYNIATEDIKTLLYK